MCRAHYGPLLSSAYATLGRRAGERAGYNGYRDHVVEAVTREAVDAMVLALAPTAAAVLSPTAALARANGWPARRCARVMVSLVNLTLQQLQRLAAYEVELRSDPRAAARRIGRDRRYDADLLRGDLPDARTRDRMVETMRFGLERQRVRGLAAQELWEAAQAVQIAVWLAVVQEGQAPAGRLRKFWVTQADQHVRHSHDELPGKYPDGVEIDGAFVTTLGQLRYPCDPRGASEDVIGCRCRLDYRVV